MLEQDYGNGERVVRIKLRQKQAHYGRPECVDNRMTYPLPPHSTVIGALHNACGFKSYHEMEVSIQGKYQSMQKEVFMYQSLNNRREDDRGNLVYLHNADMLSAGHILVAKALKNQGNSFKNNITIDIVDYEKMETYWDLLKRSDDYKLLLEGIKQEKSEFKKKEKQIKERLKQMDKKSEEYVALLEELNSEKDAFSNKEAQLKEKKYLEYDEPISHYKTLIKGPRYTEVLYGVELVIHVRAQKEIIDRILECQNQFISLGRSEDFVEIIEMVEVQDLMGFHNLENEHLSKDYAAYIEKKIVDHQIVMLKTGRDAVGVIPAKGTVHYLPKDYQVNPETRKREFHYHWMYYISNHIIPAGKSNRHGGRIRTSKPMIDDSQKMPIGKNLLVDGDGYIVNFI